MKRPRPGRPARRDFERAPRSLFYSVQPGPLYAAGMVQRDQHVDRLLAALDLPSLSAVTDGHLDAAALAALVRIIAADPRIDTVSCSTPAGFAVARIATGERGQ